ncbi:MAG: endopeptidase La, partial [Steroidobacteraceae bacterium]|nr:endopeptidase La [Steroidobacteraceae bacterium]
MPPNEHTLLLLPIRNVVLFPGVVLPLSVGRERSVAAVQEAVRSKAPIGVVLQRDPEQNEPTIDDLHTVGTVATILRLVTAGDGTHHIVCKGEQRFEILAAVPDDKVLRARVRLHDEPTEFAKEIEARGLFLRERAAEAVELLPQVPAEVVGALQSVESPIALADFVGNLLDVDTKEKQRLLETFDLKERLDRVLVLLNERIEVLKISKDISERTRAALGERQKEAVLREQLRQIRHELGEDEEGDEGLAELRAALDAANMPQDVAQQARRELARLERMGQSGVEYSMLRTYLEFLVSLPWSRLDTENLDVAHARQVLDEDHYGLDKIKRRILEFLAVRKLNPSGRSPILCFVGPPGVGKTSLGQSIARALGLKFGRVSLGGVHDEAEIRGHRRTYVGALAGNIMQSIAKCGTRNPVLMLDEVDKLGVSHQGDPAAALLEVLDPEQNNSFRDNYLGVPFDLSKVLFLCTANVLDTIPPALRDRMEVIELTGYTADEKLEIAKRHLLRRQLQASGLDAAQVNIEDSALRSLIDDYTREAGCRNLERQIGAVLRSLAVRIASGESPPLTVTAADLPSILGPPQFENEVALRVSVPGVATGLAWTPAGG